MSFRPVLVRVSGPSGSGKTSLICGLVSELQDRGYRVGVIKHDVHDTWQWDDPNKDTGRAAKAGADAVGIVSPGRYGLYQKRDDERRVEDLAGAFRPAPDVILLEGFSTLECPGFRYRNGQWIDDRGHEYGDEELSAIADGIESRLSGNSASMQLFVDGDPVPLRQFPGRVLMNLLEGFVRLVSGPARSER